MNPPLKMFIKRKDIKPKDLHVALVMSNTIEVEIIEEEPRTYGDISWNLHKEFPARVDSVTDLLVVALRDLAGASSKPLPSQEEVENYIKRAVRKTNEPQHRDFSWTHTPVEDKWQYDVDEMLAMALSDLDEAAGKPRPDIDEMRKWVRENTRMSPRNPEINDLPEKLDPREAVRHVLWKLGVQGIESWIKANVKSGMECVPPPAVSGKYTPKMAAVRLLRELGGRDGDSCTISFQAAVNWFNQNVECPDTIDQVMDRVTKDLDGLRTTHHDLLRRVIREFNPQRDIDQWIKAMTPTPGTKLNHLTRGLGNGQKCSERGMLYKMVSLLVPEWNDDQINLWLNTYTA